MSTDAHSHHARDPSPTPRRRCPTIPSSSSRWSSSCSHVLRQTRHENEQLQHRLDLLLRRLYGPRTERFDPNQPLLIPDAFDARRRQPRKTVHAAADPRPEAQLAPRRSSAATAAGHLPKDLPRVPGRLRVDRSRTPLPGVWRDSNSRSAPSAASSSITSRRSLFVVEHLRCTYACPHCEGQVVTAGKPAQPIPKGLPGPGLLAHVITEKYADHIPLYRQERRLARQGVEIVALDPLRLDGRRRQDSRAAVRPDEDVDPAVWHDSHRRHAGEGAGLGAEDQGARAGSGSTGGDYPVSVQRLRLHHEPIAGRSESVSQGLSGLPASRRLRRLRRHLRRRPTWSRSGAMRTRGASSSRRRRRTCRARLRRWPSIASSTPSRRRSRRRSPRPCRRTRPTNPARAAIRLRIRQEQAVPVLERFGKWLEAQKPDVLPKSPLGTAIGYVQNQLGGADPLHQLGLPVDRQQCV